MRLVGVLALCTAAAVPAAAFQQPRTDWYAVADLFFKVAARDDEIPSAGLPRAVAQDGAGFIWLATDGGLARWDGSSFKSYGTDAAPGAGALPDLLVNMVHADRAGTLWLGMSADGLLWHDGTTEQFRRPANRTVLDSAHVATIVDDGSGGLWIGSDAGLGHVDGRTRRVTMEGLPQGIPDGLVGSVLADRSGALWIAVDGVLLRRGAGQARFTAVTLGQSRDRSADGITDIHQDRQGRIWLSTRGAGYLVLGDPSRAVLHVSVIFDGVTPRLGNMIDMEDGLLWSASRAGIIAVDTRTMHVRRIGHDTSLPGSLPEDGLNHLARDRAGLVWIAGDSTLDYVDPEPREAIGVVKALGHGSPSVRYTAWSVAAAPDGSIWYGSADHPVGRLSRDGNGSARRMAGPRRGAVSFAGSARWGMFSVGEEGLYAMAMDGRSARRLSTHAASRLLLDGDRLYVGSDGGVAVVDLIRQGAPRPLPWSYRLSDGRVRSLALAPDGALWVGTASGLNRVDLRRGAVRQFRRRDGLQANYISTLLFDRRGRLWAGTIGGGLTVFEGTGDRWRATAHIGRHDGLPHDTIDKLLPGANNMMWASTDGGIACINTDTHVILPLRPFDGLAFTANWTAAGDVLPGGVLVFAGFGGLTIIHPPTSTVPPMEAPLRFTAIVASGGAITDLRHGVRLTPGDRSLTAEFGKLDYAASRDIAYQYRMLPLEDGWTQVDAQHRVARYTNLPPGRFTLVVRATGRDGRMTQVPLILPVDVAPRWRETVLFRLMLGVGLILAILAGMNLRMRAARRRQILLEELVTQRTAELRSTQDELEKLAYTDTLTGLSNRRLYAETLIRLLDGPDADDFCLILIDLDRFKAVNDELGHDVGDALLVDVGDRLTAGVRERDRIFRLGGDEFAILALRIHAAPSVEQLCARLLAAFDAPVIIHGHPVRAAVSIGIAVAGQHGTTPETLYKAADCALYAAKRSGRGTWRLADADAG